jgi:hypothetical protein
VEPPAYLLTAIEEQWRLLTIPLLLLAVFPRPEFRPLLFAAIFNLAVHSVIAHKEYRFIELTTAIAILLAAVRSVDIARWLGARMRRPVPALAGVIALIVAWSAASAALGSGRSLDRWFGERLVGPRIARVAGQDQRICGIGTMMVEYWQLSRVYIGRPVPIVMLDNTPRPFPRLRKPGGEGASFNAVIGPSGSQEALPGYTIQTCNGEEPYRRCLYVRPGGCTPTEEARRRDLQTILQLIDL